MRNKKNILVIDDEPHIVEILDKFFSLQGFKVKKACDGWRALDILRRDTKIDIIILDERMPGMAGTNFLKEMKKLEISVPVLGLTGSIEVQEVMKPHRKLYKHIFVKPVRLSEILESVNEVLGT